MRFVFIIMRLVPLSFLLLTACSSGLRMDYAVKTQQEVEKVSAWSKLDGAQQTTYLNELIGATQLDQLLDEAMKANPGLQQTLLTLKIRQAEYRQTNGSRLPTASAGFEATKKEGNDAAYTGSAAISWEADLWGKLATNSTAAGKDVAQQQALYQSARDTLAAEVMTAWLGLIAQQRSINIEQRRLGTLSQNEQFILQRYRKGLGTLEDLDSARSSVASSQATLEQYKEALAQQKRSLRSLLGRSAHLDLDILNDYPDVMIPLSDLPEQTLNRRPDLKAAYLAIEAADLRTSVAYKDLLPSISLEAALTDVADTPRQALFTNPVWSLLGQLTAPLFQGGQLKAAAEIAELETASAYQAYRETLLTAVTEVENALGQECSLAKQQAHLEKALENSRNNLEQYRNSYRKGLTEILDLLNVEQETYDLEAQLDNLIYERLANRVSLGLALGLGVHL